MCKSFCDHEAMTTMIKKKKKKNPHVGDGRRGDPGVLFLEIYISKSTLPVMSSLRFLLLLKKKCLIHIQIICIGYARTHFKNRRK